MITPDRSNPAAENSRFQSKGSLDWAQITFTFLRSQQSLWSPWSNTPNWKHFLLKFQSVLYQEYFTARSPQGTWWKARVSGHFCWQSENIQEKCLFHYFFKYNCLLWKSPTAGFQFPQAVRTEAQSRASGQPWETAPWVCLWVLSWQVTDLLRRLGDTMGDEAFKQRSEKQAERMWLLRGCLPHAESSRGETVRVLCEKAMKSSTEEQRQPGDQRGHG